MKKILSLAICLAMPLTAFSAPVSISIDATIVFVEGSYSPALATGDAVSGTFVYDVDELNASSAQTTPSTNPGHEFSSFYEFPSPPYDVQLYFPSTLGSFSNAAPVGVVVNDNLDLTADETGGQIADGNYDWIEILGATSSDFAGPNTPSNGEDWTLAIIADDNNWFSDGSVIPDTLPATYTALLVGIDFDSVGNEVGIVLATVNSLSTSAVPIPGGVWLLGSALLGLFGYRKGAVA